MHTLCSAKLLTLIESLTSPVGFPDDETSACLCIEIRKASTPISPILFPAMWNKVSMNYFLKAAFTQNTRQNDIFK